MTNPRFFLEGLSNSDIKWLSNIGRINRVTQGHLLIEENQQPKSLYIVLTGSFSVRLTNLQNQTVAFVKQGEVLGEMSYVDGRSSSATVVAEQDSEILNVPRNMLDEKLETDLDLACRFYKAISFVLAERLRYALNPELERAPVSSDHRIHQIIKNIQNMAP